jgi:hypothetical protein
VVLPSWQKVTSRIAPAAGVMVTAAASLPAAAARDRARRSQIFSEPSWLAVATMWCSSGCHLTRLMVRLCASMRRSILTDP